MWKHDGVLALRGRGARDDVRGSAARSPKVEFALPASVPLSSFSARPLTLPPPGQELLLPPTSIKKVVLLECAHFGVRE